MHYSMAVFCVSVMHFGVEVDNCMSVERNGGNFGAILIAAVNINLNMMI